MIQSSDFPRLTVLNHKVTSPPDLEYNCIAWAAGDAKQWWQPGSYWPVEASTDDCGLGVLERLFASFGYSDCGMDATLESGFEKVALYGSGRTATREGKVDKQAWRRSRHRTRQP
jgi:hypothetical protein